MQIIHHRQIMEREEERIRKKILSNEEELMNIQNKKTTLKTFFNPNTVQITRDLTEEVEVLRVELDAVQLTILYMYELFLTSLIPAFKEKRYRLWTRAYREMIKEEALLNLVLS
jgi:hypothetical protein